MRRRGGEQLLIGRAFGKFRVELCKDVFGHDRKVQVAHTVKGGVGLRRTKGKANCVVVQLLERSYLATVGPGVGPDPTRDVGVQNVVLIGEHHVVSGKGDPIRPPGPLDQVHGQAHTVVRPFPTPRQPRCGLGLLHHPHRKKVYERLLHHLVDAEPALRLTRAPVPAHRRDREGVAPDTTVHAQTVDHASAFKNPRLFGQTFGYRGQLSRLDHSGEFGGLLIAVKRSVFDDIRKLQFGP